MTTISYLQIAGLTTNKFFPSNLKIAGYVCGYFEIQYNL